jgi:hypothetical protein
MGIEIAPGTRPHQCMFVRISPCCQLKLIHFSLPAFSRSEHSAAPQKADILYVPQYLPQSIPFAHRLGVTCAR